MQCRLVLVVLLVQLVLLLQLGQLQLLLVQLLRQQVPLLLVLRHL